MGYRDIIAAHIVKTMPDDVTLLWDNITAHIPRQQRPFITISISEVTARDAIPYFLRGMVSFTISAPMGTGPQFHDDMAALIRKEICYTNIGFLSLLNRRTAPFEAIGGYSHLVIEVDFIQYDGQAHG